MDYRDKIARFLAGLMEEREEKNFREELKNNDLLSGQFNKMENQLKNFETVSRPVDEDPYFNNLVPKVREKIQQEKKPFRVSVLAPVFSAAFIILTGIFMLRSPGAEEMNILSEDEIASLIGSELNENETKSLEILFHTEMWNYSDDENFASLDLNSEYLENSVSPDNYYNINDYISGQEMYRYIEEIPDEEFEKIYNTILEKKIL